MINKWKLLLHVQYWLLNFGFSSQGFSGFRISSLIIYLNVFPTLTLSFVISLASCSYFCDVF